MALSRIMKTVCINYPYILYFNVRTEFLWTRESNNFVKPFTIRMVTIRVLNNNKLTRKINKILETGCLINNKYYFSILEIGKSKIMTPVDSVSGEDHFLRDHHLPVTLHGIKGKGFLWSLFIKVLMPHHLPISPPPNTSPWGLGFQKWILRG